MDQEVVSTQARQRYPLFISTHSSMSHHQFHRSIKVNMTRKFLFAYCIKQTSLIMMVNFIFASEASFLLERGFSNSHFAQKVSLAKTLSDHCLASYCDAQPLCYDLIVIQPPSKTKQVWRLRYPKDSI